MHSALVIGSDILSTQMLPHFLVLNQVSQLTIGCRQSRLEHPPDLKPSSFNHLGLKANHHAALIVSFHLLPKT